MRIRTIFTLLLLTSTGFTSGCPESNAATDAGTDATVTFDAPPAPEAGADAAPDSGPVPGPGEVGAACTSDADCAGGTCMTEFPGGYCVRSCSPTQPCPIGAFCFPSAPGSSDGACMDMCDPTAPPKQCRSGYGCTGNTIFPVSLCTPGCEVDTDCDEGLRCDPAGGYIGNGHCFDPEAELGQACASARDCPMRSWCFLEGEHGWPGGSCVGVTNCDVATDTGCPDGTHCLPDPSFEDDSLCFIACETEADCRDGYACQALDDRYPDRRVCVGACTSDAQCVGDGFTCDMASGRCVGPEGG